jgi:hypothetical protein
MMQITLLMLPNRTSYPSIAVGWLIIVVTACVFVFVSIPFLMSIRLAQSTKVETASKITKTLYYSLYLLVISLVGSTLLSIVYLSSLGNQSQLGSVIVIVTIFRILWSALLIYSYLGTKKAAVNCKVQILAYHDFLI